MAAPTSVRTLGGARRTGRTPVVCVDAQPPEARRVLGLLELNGVEAVVSSPSASTVGEFDVAVLVVQPSCDTQQELTRLRESHPDARLVVVVEATTPAEARQLLVDGVAGFVLRAQLESALAPTIQAVRAGQIAYPAGVMPQQLRSALSKREKQILGMVVLGFSNAEIAAKLFVSESTVKSHLSSAFATLGVRSRKDAVALILDPDAGFGTGILAITDPISR